VIHSLERATECMAEDATFAERVRRVRGLLEALR